jgi:hypothetical protein
MGWIGPVVAGGVIALAAVLAIAFPEDLIRASNAGTKPGSWRSAKATSGGIRAAGIVILALAIGITVVGLIPGP